ncbi:MAG: hypothetical protein JNL17_10625 [Cyclobacteriaceae bacterium]|nr:hypothetical protein [Cyclobacteriaceae bacterium]
MAERFKLESYSGPRSRFTCPSCGKNREFTRYIDLETGQYIAEHVGICNRRVNCGYHLSPAEFLRSAHTQKNAQISTPLRAQQRPELPKMLIPANLFLKSINHKHYAKNNLFEYLRNVVGLRNALSCARAYHLGTSKRWPGATIFWQVDATGAIFYGKLMCYDAKTGKRDKTKFDSAHSVLRKSGQRTAHIRQILFGEHLLSIPTPRAVAVVESEKTAMISSCYLPEITWLACGSISNLTAERMEPLRSRQVVLYPDLGAFSKWAEKAEAFQRIGFNVHVSDILEKASFVSNDDRIRGFDLADYLPRTGKPPYNEALDILLDKYPPLQELVIRVDLA